MAQRALRCFAYGDDDHWEAFCIDLNLAVQGRSLEEVRTSLTDMIHTYIEDVKKEAPADRARLLHRRAPAGVWVKYYLGALLTVSRNRRDKHRQTFELPCHA